MLAVDDACLFYAQDCTPRVWDNLLGDDRAGDQDDSDCEEANAAPRVSLDGAGLTVEGLVARKDENFFMEPVQTVAPATPIWKAFLQEELGDDDAEGSLSSPDDNCNNSVHRMHAMEPAKRRHRTAPHARRPHRQTAEHACRDLTAAEPRTDQSSSVERLKNAPPHVDKTGQTPQRQPRACKRLGGARLCLPRSETAGRDRYLCYWKVRDLSGSLTFGGITADVPLAADWTELMILPSKNESMSRPQYRSHTPSQHSGQTGTTTAGAAAGTLTGMEAGVEGCAVCFSIFVSGPIHTSHRYLSLILHIRMCMHAPSFSTDVSLHRWCMTAWNAICVSMALEFPDARHWPATRLPSGLVPPSSRQAMRCVCTMTKRRDASTSSAAALLHM